MSDRMTPAGPLVGIRVVELGGIGPVPFAGMTLGELGAEVVRIDRPAGTGGFLDGAEHANLLNRGKRSVGLDLKHPGGAAIAHALVARADVVLEGFRPGVAERLGLGPKDCQGLKPALVYGRMTGWGATGPLAERAGHDIDYIAVTGALDGIGPAGGAPQVPLNLVGDFGGGGMYLVAGVLAGLLEAQRTGVGPVVDAAIVDGTAHLMTSIHAIDAAGRWSSKRASNEIDGGAPYYAVYRTADDRYLAVGAIEPAFYRRLIEILGVDLDLDRQTDRSAWPHARATLAAAIGTRTRDEWVEAFDGVDACVAPVLDLREAREHPQLAARGTLQVRDGMLQAAPAPRFSGRPLVWPTAPPRPGADTAEVLEELGVPVAETLASGAAFSD